MKPLLLSDLANAINTETQTGSLHYAAGLIRETRDLWRTPATREMLCPEAAGLVERYLEIETQPTQSQETVTP